MSSKKRTLEGETEDESNKRQQTDSGVEGQAEQKNETEDKSGENKIESSNYVLDQAALSLHNIDPKLSIRVLLESKKAGSLIGKGGVTIKKYREMSGARIDMGESVKYASKRVVTVIGSMDKVMNALILISTTLGEKKTADGQQQAAPPGEEQQAQVVLLVPNTQVGVLLGRGGSTIKATREATGALIKVSEQPLEGSDEKSVTLRGTRDSVQKAITSLCVQLLQAQDRQPAKVLYQPRPDLIAAMTSNLGSSGSNPFANPLTDLLFMQQQQQQPNSSSHQLQQQQQQQQHLQQQMFGMYGMGGPSSGLLAPPVLQQQAPVSNEPTSTVTIPVPDHLIGSIIGRGGATIKELRARSRATIHVAHPQPGQTQRLVTITGTTQANEVAVGMIYQKMAAVETQQQQQ